MNGAVSDISMTGTTQGVCPTNWHLPTHHEYTTLERAVCASGTCITDFPYDFSTMGYRGTDEGSRLAGNAALWTNGALDSEPDFSASGFGSLPGGCRNYTGTFNNVGNTGYWWSASEYSASIAWYRELFYLYSTVNRASDYKSYGFSVRCVRD